MFAIVFLSGLLAAFILIALMLRTWWQSDFRVWPPPAPGSWQSRTFWTLFRILNVATIGCAILDLRYSQNLIFSLPLEVQAIAFAVLIVSLYGYGLALLSLGKENTYCDRNGLITNGIYKWTRNPQYATIIPFYLSLALVTDTVSTYVLALSMCTVYYLMAVVEEPWLRESYGQPYIAYCRRVPRFFNAHRAAVWAYAKLRTASRWIETS